MFRAQHLARTSRPRVPRGLSSGEACTKPEGDSHPTQKRLGGYAWPDKTAIVFAQKNFSIFS